MMVYVAFQDDSVFPVMFLRLYQVQEIPDLKSYFLTLLKVVDISQQQLHSLILAENDQTYD